MTGYTFPSMNQKQTVAAPRVKTGYLPTLDGWRAVAIGMVLMAHMHRWPAFLSCVQPVIQPYGFLGVDLFFAISGLLICHRLLEEERVFGRISLRGFYLRRSFRIFPPAFLYLGVIAVLGMARVLPTAWITWSSALIFLRNYASLLFGDDAQNLYTAHFWSLAIEEHFYLFLPALLVFLPRWRKHALLVLTIASFAWVVLYARLTPLEHRSFFWTRRTDLHMGSLLFPAWLAVVLTAQNARERLRRVLHPAVLVAFVLLFAGAKLVHHHYYAHRQPLSSTAQGSAAANAKGATDDSSGNAGGEVIYTTDRAGRPIQHVTQRTGGLVSLFLNFMVPMGSPVLILFTLLRPESMLGRLLECGPLRWIGRLSYSLYLWQQIFWDGNSLGWPIHAVQHPQMFALALVFAAAASSFYWIERPFIRIGHRLAPPATLGHRDTSVSS